MTASAPITIGNATLYLGDCREILPTLGNVDAVITDPPFEIKNKFGTSSMYGFRRMEFHFDIKGVTDEVVIPALDDAFDKCNAFHVFCDPEQYAGIANIARAKGFTPKPWAKQKLCSPPPMPGNWWPSSFELAMYGYKPCAYFGDKSAKRKNMMVFDSYRHSIRASEKEDHPTQKWLPMMLYLVNTMIKDGGTALDPFMGSGSTGVACTNLGRRFIGIELEPRYFDIACRRIEDAHRQQDMFVTDTLPTIANQESLFKAAA
jgi:DNA modification methylase